MRKYFWKLMLSGMVLLIALAISAPLGAAEKFPTRPITIVVPFAAGGLANIIIHTLAPIVEKDLGVPIVVVEKPGSGGAVGWRWLQSEKPDGYTLGSVSKSIYNATHTTKGKVDFRAFDPIVVLTEDYFSVTVNVDSQWKTLADYVKYAKANPGKMRAGSSGTGGMWHISILAFNKVVGCEIIHIPFKGGAEAVVAVLGNHIESTFATPGDMTGVLESGKLRILAIGGPKRNPFYPAVPTAKEAGVDLVMGNWRGLAAPKGVPKERIDIIEKSFAKAVQSPKYQEFMKSNRLTNDFEGSADWGKHYLKDGEAMLEILKTIEP
jgi:tripartite-type tricarboxylate transporter receptor subunit TctC